MLEDIKLSRKKELYYTPEPEEFRVGFEYEYRVNPHKENCYVKSGDTVFEFYGTEKEKVLTEEEIKKKISYSIYNDVSIYDWRFHTMTVEKLGLQDWGEEYPVYCNDDYEVRVKYLDRKDIEELGFICNGWEFGLHSYNFNYNNPTSKYNCPYRLDVIGHSNKVLIRYPLSDGETLFLGTIKNKSELKQILKMLEIINE